MILRKTRAMYARSMKLIIVLALLTGILWTYVLSREEFLILLTVPARLRKDRSTLPASFTYSSANSSGPKAFHPIDDLIDKANQDFDQLLAMQTSNLNDAAKVYRARRGRQPPPRFDIWHKFAQNYSALIIEEFFDQIYTDLAPFWAISPTQISNRIKSLPNRLTIRSGEVGRVQTKAALTGAKMAWVDAWQDMILRIARWLPDMDIPLNLMDESRLVVPWEDVSSLMTEEARTRQLMPDDLIQSDWVPTSDHPANSDDEPDFDPAFQGEGPYWPIAVSGCPPWSRARRDTLEYAANADETLQLTKSWPENSYKGYISNWTTARSLCDQPHLRDLHGSLIEPISISTSTKMVPLFGGSKLSVNNDILLPPAMYWVEDSRYSGGKYRGPRWESKVDAMVWRGVASGGRNRRENWTKFQRHRFVAMGNSTTVSNAAAGHDIPHKFLPSRDLYGLAAKASELGDWINTWADAAFTKDLFCFPYEGSPLACSYTGQYFELAAPMSMQKQYLFKYLPDIDGNSFSGRYRAFLLSTSAPIKATLYTEWHDSRLIPWRHFIPMDNTFIDFYGIMEYCVGNPLHGVLGHDHEAQKIATEGSLWAEKVLRKEDMEIYVFRLLLEYARLCHQDRDFLGWREGDVRHVA